MHNVKPVHLALLLTVSEMYDLKASFIVCKRGEVEGKEDTDRSEDVRLLSVNIAEYC